MDWTLITGGAKGLGRELCLKLATKKLPILVHYKSSEKEANQVVKECQKLGVKADCIYGDFSSLESTLQFTKNCLEEFKSVKNLINNVGNYLIKPASETKPQEWTDLFQVNLHAPFSLIHAFLPSIIENQGNIINIGVVGINNIRADINRTAYATTKMALWMLTKSLAKELMSKNVRVNMVSPGYLESAIDIPNDYSNLLQASVASFEDITRAIEFLISESSKYITGQNLEVGGGLGLVH